MSDKKISKVITDLKDARTAAEMSQSDLGLIMGYTNAKSGQSVVSGWESELRSPTLDRLEAWADALGMMVVVVPKK